MYTTNIIRWVRPHAVMCEMAREFTAKGWLRGLKHWLWCRWSKPEPTIHLARIEEKRLADLVCRAMDEMDRPPDSYEYVIVGPRQAMDTKCEMAEALHWMVGVRYEDQGGFRLCGVPVRIVPWFDGVLLVPKESR